MGPFSRHMARLRPALLEAVAPAARVTAAQGYLQKPHCTIITGWAWDPHQPDVPLEVEIYDGERRLATVPAYWYRRDLARAGLGGGRHAYRYTPPAALKDGRVHLPLETHLNGALAGDPNAGPEMHFSFFDLIAHLAKTRAYTAGTIVGSGTVSNADPARGVSCLAERRMREILEHGKPETEFLKAGDRVHIEMKDARGASLFGAIEQTVVPFTKASPR